MPTAFNELLEAEMDEHLQAAKYERTEDRKGERNSHYKRELTMRVGPLELRVPPDRDNTVETAIFDRYQRS
jgi:transposase-like protein